MKVFLKPNGLHSKAMTRVAERLEKHAPEGVEIVSQPYQADVEVLHVIGSDVFKEVRPREYVVIQYCLKSAGGSVEDWQKFWGRSRFVWSYYDLPINGVPFYFSPLGVDGRTFRLSPSDRRYVMTSGYVNGPGAEPIEIMASAAAANRMYTIHIGPSSIENMSRYPRGFTTYLDIPDAKLCDLYNSCLWVSGMRYVEGFELPALEGLACGARPICFDRPDMRQWYNGHAVFVPETTGPVLQRTLTDLLQSIPDPVTIAEREKILDKFSWPKIAEGFWQQMGI